MRSTKDQLVEKDVLMPVKHNVFLWNIPDVEESLSVPFFVCFRFSSGLHGNTAADSVRSEWPLWHAAKSQAVFARRRNKPKLKLLDIRTERAEREKGERERNIISNSSKTKYPSTKSTALFVVRRERSSVIRVAETGKIINTDLYGSTG
ncbi:hypothetical protein TNCV_3520481 [Trichonephila clavipes]|nr:hypothetical protein TNCV_3520481 [Trichonephila clavipes]